MFKGKKLLITGGTGSFGSTVLQRFVGSDLAEIRIFSRDEKKQEDQRIQYGSDQLSFHIGDVRDLASVRSAIADVDYIFHAAALKQVPSCEFFPMEAVKTNVIGTDNVLTAAIDAGVSRVVCLSTDKAVYPINAMGISKAMMEKVVGAKARNSADTRISITRYGNVIGSRGSVIPLFMEQIRRGQPMTITKPSMTRFMMTLEQSVDLVLYAFEHGSKGDIFVQKAPAARLSVLTEAVAQLMNTPNAPVKVIGKRHGEKDYEALLSVEELARGQDLGTFFRVAQDGRSLNYSQFITDGEEDNDLSRDGYHSSNTQQLDAQGVCDLLRSTAALEF
ncbi:polysaccharide biosynthesis protein [Pseudogemmobacter faecipullorum]|uniref:UDP-glucose 4-epimerase n=1 Tax=Pseudogemmobacter faecipullorum TaxID=2755041 RepID=A0ABS8CRJ0_9RHOB|nr:polysaccharide biosynthesis protein [Pseudogemmobacter faecipullorum]MCB5411983.1 polysaccharide biosynthesis protein [Pseudogemmobacter faecipullorum]